MSAEVSTEQGLAAIDASRMSEADKTVLRRGFLRGDQGARFAVYALVARQERRESSGGV